MNTFCKSRLLATGLLGLLAQAATAQTAGDAAAPKAPTLIPQTFLEPSFYIWLLVAFILVIVIIALSQAVNSLSRTIQEKSGLPVIEEAVRPASRRKDTAWTRMMHALTASVPVEKEEDVMMHHNYDGIHELDNQLPPWWKWGFYFTILFALVYLVNYHVSGTGKLQLAEYQDAMKEAELAKEARMKASADFVTEASVTALKEASAITAGHDIYMKNCVACHGDKGQGGVGPNLTDDFWIHGGGIKNIFRTVTEGVPAKGMISWKSQLSPKQIQEVGSFILTLYGTNPPGAKEPQGDKWMEAGATPADSATATPKDSAGAAVAVK
jgi:cytochrome c oxidase cbb3-type subunit 3